MQEKSQGGDPLTGRLKPDRRLTNLCKNLWSDLGKKVRGKKI